jgi:lipopolysaccharide cholinephosphotransferase
MEHMEFDLKEMHIVQLNLLKKLDSVCQERGFSYFLGFGTLLGAVREHGIIEWDDGIDIVMPYRDYLCLTELPQVVWGTDCFMQTYISDPEFNRYYAKLRDNNTTLILADDVTKDINHGIPINIYPIINLANDEEERHKQIRNAKLYKAFMERKPVDAGDSLLHVFSAALLEVMMEHQLIRFRDYLKKETVKYEGEHTNCCLALAGNKSLDLVLFKTWFSSFATWDFEGMQTRIPAGWHEWLKLRYGDYMKTPIAELQGSTISNFVTLNPHKPFKYYKGKTYCV